MRSNGTQIDRTGSSIRSCDIQMNSMRSCDDPMDRPTFTVVVRFEAMLVCVLLPSAHQGCLDTTCLAFSLLRTDRESRHLLMR